MLNKPYFKGLPGGISLSDIQNKKAGFLYGTAGLNSGNFLFANAIRNLLGYNSLAPQPEMNDTDSNYDYIVIPAANWISPGADLTQFVEFLEENQLPCLVSGLGAQMSFGENLPKLKPSVMRFLSIVSERSKYISVRGPHTQEVLEKLGITNTWVTGCPSILGKGKIPQISTQENAADYKNIVLQGTRHYYSENIFNQNKSANLNLEIYRYAMANNKALLLQSEFADICYAMDKKEKVEVNERNESYLQKIYQQEDEKIKKYLNQHGLIFWNLEQWFDELSNYDCLIGTRIHGAISAILSGIPSTLLTHDNRTVELAETMNIPYYDIRKIDHINDESIHNILSMMDFSKFNSGREKYSNNFKKFFAANNVESTL
jgi:polysaccharide pyruvyl transferase WcaK-like protein